MHVKNIKKLDLVSLEAFLVLYETCNTVQAAHKLNISQSAVSRILTKLREAFEDRLFIRNQHGLVPTIAAQKLAKSLPAAIENLFLAYDISEEFDPARLDGEIRIAMSSVFITFFGEKLYEKIHKMAPNVRLILESWDVNTTNKIIHGDIELGLNYELEPSLKNIYTRTIMEDSTCAMLKIDHPLLANKINIEQLVKYDFYGYTSLETSGLKPRLKKFENVHNISLPITLYSSVLTSLIDTVCNTDGILLGSALVQRMYPEKLAILNIEKYEDVMVPISLFISVKNRTSLKHQWLDGIVVSLFKEQTNTVKLE